MQILWKLEKAFVKDIRDRFPSPKPAYNTISTIVRILEKKGFVNYTAYGKSHQYYPMVSMDQYKKHISKSLLSKYYEGSLSKLVSFFAKQEKLSAKELDQILNELNSKNE